MKSTSVLVAAALMVLLAAGSAPDNLPDWLKEGIAKDRARSTARAGYNLIVESNTEVIFIHTESVLRSSNFREA